MPNIIKKKLDEYNQISQGEELVIQDENRLDEIKGDKHNRNGNMINIQDDQTDSDARNQLEINKKRNNNINTFNIKKKKLSTNDFEHKSEEIINDNDNNINDNKKENNNNELQNNNKLEIKKVSSIENKKDEQPGSKDILVNDKNSENKNTNK